MKKLLIFMIAVVAMASCNNCDNDEFQSDSSMVSVSLNPSFSSGNITRATSTEMYSEIYAKISKLIEDSYTLVFTETTTGKSYTFTGNWGNSILIKSGTYRVVGTSTAYGDIIQERCSLKFNTEVTIKATDTSVVLSAQYDCFLLLFDKNIINNVSILYGTNDSKVEEKTLFESDNIIYCFAKKIYNERSSARQFIVINYNDGSQESVSTNNKVFETGKFYTWDGNSYIKNGVSIPQMTQGYI